MGCYRYRPSAVLGASEDWLYLGSGFQVVIHRLSGSCPASFCLLSRNCRIFCRDAASRRVDVFMLRKPVKYVAQQPAIHLSCAYLMGRSPSYTDKTQGLFACLQDLALKKFLIRLSSTVWSRHMALLLSGPPKEACGPVTVTVSNKKITTAQYLNPSY
jgi:hypothetical protein